MNNSKEFVEELKKIIKKIIEKISWLPYETINRIMCRQTKIVEVNNWNFFNPIRFHMELIEDDDFHSLTRNLQAYKMREPRYSREYINFIEDKDVVLDVGANIGFFTILSNDAKKIIAIEPVKRCIPILKNNIYINDMKNVEILNVALGNGDQLYIEETKAVNLSKIVNKKGKNTKEINSYTLDYFVKMYNINFVKIDAEGYEYEIFGKGKIPKEINKISMEFHTGLMGKEKSEAIINNFYDNGFYVSKMIEDLPLRLYPFMKLLTHPMTWIKKDLTIGQTLKHLFKGRSVRYLQLKRRIKNE